MVLDYKLGVALIFIAILLGYYKTILILIISVFVIKYAVSRGAFNIILDSLIDYLNENCGA